MNISDEKKENNIESYNNNSFSEIIVKKLIDKIISLTITKVQNKKQKSDIPLICFNFSKNILNNYISWNFISYDKDETKNDDKTIINNSESQIFQSSNLSQIIGNNNDNSISYFQNSMTDQNFEKKIFFSNYVNSNSINDWNIMDEPKSNKYDRYVTNLTIIKSDKMNKFKVEEDKIVKEEEDEDEQSRISKNSSKHSLKIVNPLFNSTKKIKSKPLLSVKKKPNTEDIPKKLNEVMNEFSFHSIKEEKEENNKKDLYNSIDVEKLIEEFEARKELNKLDLNRINKKNMIKINKIKLEEESFKKYQGKKITKDHNGQIILIKKMKLNELKKEFFTAKTTHKFIKEVKKQLNKNNDSINQKHTEKENSKNNNILINVKTKSKDVIIQKNDNLPLLRKSITSAALFPDLEELQKLNYLKDKRPCSPSGSNFNLMNMEVGVTLKENDKYKSGGKDYYSKFKKYSFTCFDKQLKEDSELNTLKYQTKYIYQHNFSPKNNNFKNLFLSQENSNIYTDNKSQKFKSKSNLSINTTNNNSISKNNHHLENKVLTYAKSTSNISSSLENNESNKPMIILSNGLSSIYDILSPIDNTLNLKDKKNLIKKNNIFRNSRKIKSLKNIFSLKDINNFNKALLTKKNFEFKKNNPFVISQYRKPEKPLINEIYKEIGFNQTISRNRNKISSLKKPTAVTTLDFFKQ